MLNVQNISFSYDNRVIIDDMSFTTKKGEVLAIVGESGSGKSTILKLIYGEKDLDNGLVSWCDKKILGPKDKLIVGPDFMKYVSQEFDLMPFTTVEENIGSYLSNFYPKKKKKRIIDLLSVVGLSEYLNTKVVKLSGGQKQRVAIAKALASQPEILLLDEPFSHIDSYKKRSLRRSLFSYLKSNEITCVVASHDRDDVLPFADSIVVVGSGKIISSGTPEDLYKNPVLPKIAAFFSEFSLVNGEIYYTNQIKIVQDSEHKAVVSKSYFNGESYIIQADFESQTVLISNSEPIDKNKTIKILFNK